MGTSSFVTISGNPLAELHDLQEISCIIQREQSNMQGQYVLENTLQTHLLFYSSLLNLFSDLLLVYIIVTPQFCNAALISSCSAINLSYGTLGNLSLKYGNIFSFSMR